MTAPAWPGPRRLAHRGGGTIAPENTIAGLREAVDRGYRGVEFDVMLTADGVPVLMHDETFGRTVAGRGAVASTTWVELSGRDAGAWLAPRFAGEPVPRYDDAVRFCVAYGLWMNVEIKPSAGRDVETGRAVASTSETILRDGPHARSTMLFSSFSPAALDAARAASREVPRGLLFDALPPRGVDEARELGCASVHVAHRRLDRAAVDRLHDAGFAVMAYTVDDPVRASTLDAWGVDAICTDRLDRIAP